MDTRVLHARHARAAARTAARASSQTPTIPAQCTRPHACSTQPRTQPLLASPRAHGGRRLSSMSRQRLAKLRGSRRSRRISGSAHSDSGGANSSRAQCDGLLNDGGATSQYQSAWRRQRRGCRRHGACDGDSEYNTSNENYDKNDSDALLHQAKVARRRYNSFVAAIVAKAWVYG